jgi:hypothetical protein
MHTRTSKDPAHTETQKRDTETRRHGDTETQRHRGTDTERVSTGDAAPPGWNEARSHTRRETLLRHAAARGTMARRRWRGRMGAARHNGKRTALPSRDSTTTARHIGARGERIDANVKYKEESAEAAPPRAATARHQSGHRSRHSASPATRHERLKARAPSPIATLCTQR